MADWSFDELAASLHADSLDVSTFHEVLAKKLEQALPSGRVEVRRKGWGFGGARPLQSVEVSLSDNVFHLENTRHGPEYRMAKVVRGIALKTEQLAMGQWLSALAEALWVEAKKSDQTRQALEQFLIGGE